MQHDIWDAGALRGHAYAMLSERCGQDERGVFVGRWERRVGAFCEGNRFIGANLHVRIYSTNKPSR